MQMVFGNTSRLLGKKYKEEARRCVIAHGLGGKGDSMGGQFLEACKADYVAKCVDRALAADPSNTLAQELRNHFAAVTQ